MTKCLKDYFPMIREREEVVEEIQKEKICYKKFLSWPEEQQEEFLDICTGVKGLKLLYDGFFKEVMNPEYDPLRLSDFLSCLLNQKVKVIRVIPTDSTRLANESALLAMDIVVELEDGSIANVEMQRIGYMFPGQRSACYSADLLLRQYKRVRGNKKDFDYRNVKNVYTIVLFEKSPKSFHGYPETYYHFFEQKSDTGLQMELLQKYLFISLDIFRENQHNKESNSKREAWLTLFSSDDPDTIMKLLEKYPVFRDIYREGYQICLNIEKVMEMFSEELYILDRNTEKYMFEEMQKELNEMREEYEEKQNELVEVRGNLEETRNSLEEAQNNLAETQNSLEEAQNNLEETQNNLAEMNEKYDQSIRNTVEILRDMGLHDQEIISKLSVKYQLAENQIKKYLYDI